MSGYTTSPTLSAVLRDLEDTERHRRCEAETWLYVADDRFECSVCGVIRTSVRYNERGIRADGISSPEAQPYRLTRPSARPADPRNGRGLVVRGSDE